MSALDDRSPAARPLPDGPGPSPARWRVLAVVTAAVVAGSTFYGVSAFQQYQARSSAAPGVAVEQNPRAAGGGYVMFRNTASGEGYGHLGSVPLAAPGGPRRLEDTACDRVYATASVRSCLQTTPGVLTTFSDVVLDPDGAQLAAWPLPGIPSRTRISPDGSLVASTAFVTGHSYAGAGFSTETRITALDGPDYGNIEDFTLLVEGISVTAADRNIWGVTFSTDGDTFYATAASGGSTWLVRGSLSARSLTALRDGVECPSISPDGRRIAFKKDVSGSAIPHWRVAVLELDSLTETVLDETRSVDDQIEWLDEGTVLYGLPRQGASGDSDVWSLDTAGGPPELFVEHAWSPAVVR